jgi:PAS domain S-box-containing protein
MCNNKADMASKNQTGNLSPNISRSLFDAISNPSIIVDKQHHIVAANLATITATGKAEKNLVGQKCYEIFQLMDQPFQACLSEKDTTSNDVEKSQISIDDLNGEYMVSVYPVSEDHDLSKALHIAHSIAASKDYEQSLSESEEKYRQIIQTANDAILVVDTETRIILEANKKAEELLGIHRDMIIGKDELDFHPKNEFEYYKKIYDGLVEKEKDVTSDIYMVNKQGKHIPVQISTSTISFKGRKVIQGIIRDLTERKKTESLLRQSQKMEALGTLSGGIAHDFNNILFSIFGYTELAMTDIPKDSRTYSFLSQVMTAADRAKELVQQILMFSRQGAQEQKPMLIQPIIKESLKLLRASVPTSIEFRQHIASACGPVLGTPSQIHQIMMNLCTNAYHAMQEKGGVLTVSLKRMENESKRIIGMDILLPGPYVYLVIRDTGTGIQPDIINRIFEPYFTTKSQSEGTGLGLSVVHGIVKSHNGVIHVESVPGQGTAFHIYLPEVISKTKMSNAQDSQDVQRGTEKILLVDDELQLVKMAHVMLENLGYKVTSTESSMDALELFCLNPDQFDIIITDQTMPKMSGVELAKKILAVRPDIPIILCTGYSSLISKETAKAIGIKSFVSKPINRVALANMLRDALRK